MTVCKIHGTPEPCWRCEPRKPPDSGWQNFSSSNSNQNYTPPKEYRRPTPRGHTHGGTRPCNIRCGINEGLSILNTNRNVLELFTDGLANCTQLIFRNATATFTCHISSTAPHPGSWTTWVLAAFEEDYGAVQACWVVTSDNGSIGDTLEPLLNTKLANVIRIKGCGGYAIDVQSGNVRNTPSFWNATSHDVAGSLTARDLIDIRYHSQQLYLGEAAFGDFCENCDICNSMF